MKKQTKNRRILISSFVLFLLSIVLIACEDANSAEEEVTPTPEAETEETKHNPDLWTAVNPLNTTVTFLNTGAHPDDERSDLLAYLSRGLGVETGSLIANRGEGGQNQIGTELGDGLGIIRSAEMVEAAEVTGVRAYHLSENTSDPIYDFGFSKTTEETLEQWDKDLTYERFIRFIRTYQPDIVMPSFRDVDSQHGHHRALVVLSLDAYEDAANPDIYPEHMDEGLSPWQIKKLYLPAESEETATLSMEIGDLDPIYDMSYPQLGEESRYLHKSQGMGNDVEVEPRQFHLEFVDSSVIEADADEELFSGIPYNFTDWADQVQDDEMSDGLVALQERLDKIVDAYPNSEEVFSEAHLALKDVQALIDSVEASSIDDELKNDLVHNLQTKEDQLNNVSLVASNLTLEIEMDSMVLNPGAEATVNVTIHNEGENAVENLEVGLVTPMNIEFNSADVIDSLPAGESVNTKFTVTVPEDAEYYHPYDEDTLQVELSLQNQDVVSTNTIPFENTVAILPEISVRANPTDLVINTADLKDGYPVTIETKNYTNDTQDVTLSLNLPEGWTSEPESESVTIEEEMTETEFTLIPPANIGDDDFTIEVVAEANGKTYDLTVQDILYDHINDDYNLYPAEISGTSFELQIPDGRKIGYVESGFDNIAEYLANVGFDMTALTEEDLASGDLSEYDTIVIGIRANLAREDLVEHNDRLHEFAENGGHLVYQYHNPWDNWEINETMPYPIEIGQPSIEWRVTDETADVEVLQSDHALFNTPNVIDDSDWDNWVQERGLYFPMNWSDEYETFVRIADPDEEPFDGGILLAEYGEGTVLYTNLVFYRQIDNQVPGGYRIFTNLISYEGNN